MSFYNRVKQFFIPEVQPEVQKVLDKETLSNMYRISLAVLVIEIFALTLFLINGTYQSEFNHHEMVSLGLVLSFMAVCCVGSLMARNILKKDELPHKTVEIVKIIFFIGFTAWAILSDFRHYRVGEQMLTFFAVELVMVCFAAFKPWLSVVLMGGAYFALYVVLLKFDGAANIQPLNYFSLCFLSIFGMILIYHYHLGMISDRIKLKDIAEKYELLSLHDQLTGLRNRHALAEDEPRLLNHMLCVYMIDIDYFKMLNDRYGHQVGDQILVKTSEVLKDLFPECYIYRYGGDEFLVISENSEGKLPDNAINEFTWKNQRRKIRVTLCCGSAEGMPASHEDFSELINKSDTELYKVKKASHEGNGYKRYQ